MTDFLDNMFGFFGYDDEEQLRAFVKDNSSSYNEGALTHEFDDDFSAEDENGEDIYP